MEEQERIDFYSKVAADYDRVATGRVGYIAHERIPQKLIALHGKTPGTVLDLACGTGLCASQFFQAGFTVDGIDYSPGMIEAARRHPYRHLFCQSIEEPLPVQDGTFDIVMAIGVTEFIKEPVALLKTMRAKLRPRGICAITIPKPCNAEEELGIVTYELETFLGFVKTVDFEILEIDEFYGWESGHLSVIASGVEGMHQKVDYIALFLRKPS